VVAWKEWWEGHKGGRIVIAPYEGVADPSLQCLARKVDWGFSGAILTIAERGDDQARSVLEKFPSPTNWGTPSIPGYLFLGLAKLGDQGKLREVHDEWEHGSDFTDAIEKLEFIGGRESVDLFIARFDLLAGRLVSAKKQRDECVAGLVQRQNLQPGAAADKYIADSWCQQNYNHTVDSVQQQRAELLGALARMVKDPGEEITWGAYCTTPGTCLHANITRQFAELAYWFPSLSYAEGAGGLAYNDGNPSPPPVTNTVTTFDFSLYAPAYNVLADRYGIPTHSYLEEQPYSVVSPAWTQIKKSLCPTCN
jgi:hypothetical protein